MLIVRNSENKRHSNSVICLSPNIRTHKIRIVEMRYVINGENVLPLIVSLPSSVCTLPIGLLALALWLDRGHLNVTLHSFLPMENACNN